MKLLSKIHTKRFLPSADVDLSRVPTHEQMRCVRSLFSERYPNPRVFDAWRGDELADKTFTRPKILESSLLTLAFHPVNRTVRTDDL